MRGVLLSCPRRHSPVKCTVACDERSDETTLQSWACGSLRTTPFSSASTAKRTTKRITARRRRNGRRKHGSLAPRMPRSSKSRKCRSRPSSQKCWAKMCRCPPPFPLPPSPTTSPLIVCCISQSAAFNRLSPGFVPLPHESAAWSFIFRLPCCAASALKTIAHRALRGSSARASAPDDRRTLQVAHVLVRKMRDLAMMEYPECENPDQVLALSRRQAAKCLIYEALYKAVFDWREVPPLYPTWFPSCTTRSGQGSKKSLYPILPVTISLFPSFPHPPSLCLPPPPPSTHITPYWPLPPLFRCPSSLHFLAPHPPPLLSSFPPSPILSSPPPFPLSPLPHILLPFHQPDDATNSHIKSRHEFRDDIWLIPPLKVDSQGVVVCTINDLVHTCVPEKLRGDSGPGCMSAQDSKVVIVAFFPSLNTCKAC